MLRLRRTAWVLATAIAVIGLIGSGAWAAATEPKIGVVDLQKVDKDAPRVTQYREEFDARKANLNQKLEIRVQNMMLNEDEIKELVDLKTSDKPTDAQKARIQALTDVERAKDDELKKLQETKDLNDQQKARLKELQDIQQKSKDAGNVFSKDYEAQLQSKFAELQDKIVADILAAVNKAAEAKGMTMVFDKAGVLFGGIDITDDVISRLDRNKTAP